MFLKQINLTNFRNYAQLKIDFDSRTVIFVGNNAAGKSNLLEAVYLLSCSKSHRSDNEDDLILEGSNFARVEGFLSEPETELLVILNRVTDEVNFRKKIVVNGLAKRALDFIGHLPAVIFYPSDINMVTGAPSLRRWHLDLALAQIDYDYKKNLTVYEQILTARNRVLKTIREGRGTTDELDFWTKSLVDKGQIISTKRRDFFIFINALEEPLGKFIFEYQESVLNLERLSETSSREVVAAATLIGPHRDDFRFIQTETEDGKGRDLAHFGSRAEQRTATLALKLAQLEYMAKILGKRPLLLLDDVFSELDAIHREHILAIVSKQQTLIAAVELENIPEDFLNLVKIFRVENGKIIEFEPQ